MSLSANIIYDYDPLFTDDGGITYMSGKVYIAMLDENGHPTDGNNAVVTVRCFTSDDAVNQDYVVPGQSYMIYQGTLTRSVNGSVFDSRSFSIVNIAGAGPSLPPSSDAVITSVTIDKKESNIGAADGQITINAFSSYGPILYSLDNVHFQASTTFIGLIGGGYTAYITDSNSGSATYEFNILTTTSLLTGDPSVNIGNTNISRWNAAFNPVTFTYQRKDFEVVNILNSTANNATQVIINGNVAAIKPDDAVYVNAGAYKGIYKVISAESSSIIINTPYITGTGTIGFLNSNTMCSYYKVVTQITYQDKLTGQTNTIISTNRPDREGTVRADLSSFLQNLLHANDDSDFSLVNYRDDNLSASYQVAYQEVWTEPSQTVGQTGVEHKSDWVSISNPYYITYSAKQLGEKHGGNMAAYVPFKTVDNPDKRAKWITDFTEPAYSIGYPFDIGFIYSEDLIGLTLYYELTALDINRNFISGTAANTFLLNDDSSYLLTEDGSRFIIDTYTTITPNQLGLNRLQISRNFPNEARYFTLALKYDDDNGTHTVTQVQTIRIDDAVNDNSVYLRWIGLTGSWNYYRFVYNQEVSLDVQNAVIIKNYVSDWENQQGIEEVISKSAGEKMKVMAEDLSVADIKGLQSIKYSPKVQMLVNRNPIKWQTIVLNTATFSEYETQYGQYAFSVTFNLPSKNIQTQ